MRPRTWTWLVVAHLVASAAHFADNVARFEQYPEPSWLDPVRVAASWVLLAGLAVLGLRWHLRGRAAGAVCLVASSLLGIAGLGHYAVPGHDMQPAMHVLIWLEAAAAVVLLAAVLVARRPVGPPSAQA